MTRFLVFILTAITCCAERPSFGLKAGAPISEVCESENLGAAGAANVCADRYLVGPAVQIDLAGGLSFDVAALFTRVQLEGGVRSTVAQSLSIQRSGSAWEFPVLLKYRVFQRRAAAPFIGAGPNFRRVAMQGQNTVIPQAQQRPSVVPIDETRWDAGVSIAGGIEFRAGLIRYSRWPSQNACSECGPFTLPLARSSSAVLLFGIAF